ncbi:MAG TPA: alpha/beta hydrolase [Casimicrobiaceae bacterium]|nr:alpha/beta hydrolase [Casimicrobiaceae bacterium]
MPNSHHLIGTGPLKVIVLHGWFGDSQTFAVMESALSINEFTYALMDYRGYGGMKGVAGEFTLDEIAIDALALADSLGFSTFAVIGHSMGGKAMQRLLVMQPERVRTLVGIAPVPASEVPFDDATWALFRDAADKRENRYRIVDYTTGGRLSPAWINAMVDYSLEHSDRNAFDAYLLAWSKTDFSDLVHGLEHPIKVIVGEHDAAIDVAVMEATYLKWYPNASLEVMRNAGHYPMNETPVALATAMEKFLRT